MTDGCRRGGKTWSCTWGSCRWRSNSSRRRCYSVLSQSKVCGMTTLDDERLDHKNHDDDDEGLGHKNLDDDDDE